jgi:antitoxin (DNA-binding transcriptional repressor) of toxin-antitoxin stability system
VDATKVGAREFRHRLGECAAAGEPSVVTRRGRPVGLDVPVHRPPETANRVTDREAGESVAGAAAREGRERGGARAGVREAEEGNAAPSLNARECSLSTAWCGPRSARGCARGSGVMPLSSADVRPVEPVAKSGSRWRRVPSRLARRCSLRRPSLHAGSCSGRSRRSPQMRLTKAMRQPPSAGSRPPARRFVRPSPAWGDSPEAQPMRCRRSMPASS